MISIFDDGPPPLGKQGDTEEKPTLRDWFAGMALQAIIAKAPFEQGPVGVDESDRMRARGAYDYADAMLSVRDAKAQQQHAIRTKSYTYKCGDGCCFEQGVDVFVGEEHICSVPSLEYAIEELFEHFGIDVRVQHG